MDWATVDIGVRIVLPGFWVGVSMVGMLVTVVGTGLLAMVSTPHYENKVESDIQEAWVEPAELIVDLMAEVGYVEEEDSVFPVFSAALDWSHLDGEVVRIEWFEDGAIQKIRYITDSGAEEEARANELSHAISVRADYLEDKKLMDSTRYAFEIVGIGFSLQFISMLARHVFVLT